MAKLDKTRNRLTALKTELEEQRSAELLEVLTQPSANNPVAYYQASGRQRTGGLDGREIASTHPVLQTSAGNRAVTLYARTIAGLPLKRYRADRQIGLPNWLRHPWPTKPHLTTSKLIYDMVFNGILEGNAFLHAPGRTRNSAPYAVESLDSDTVGMDIISKSRTEYHITTHRQPAFKHVLSDDEIIHIIFFPVAGHERGVSPFRIAFQSVNAANATLFHALGHLNNAATPPIAIKFAGGLKDEQYKRLRKRFYEQNTGPGNAGKPLVFEEGTEVEMLGHDPRAAQLVEQRELAAVEIGAMVGIPPMLMMVNTPGSVSYASAWAAIASWLRNSVEPLVRTMEEGLSRLLPPGERFEFSLSELLRGDVETRQKLGTAAVQGGWKTPNEQRAEEDLPAIPGADDLLWKQGMTPSQMMPDILEAHQQAQQQPVSKGEVDQMIASMASAE